MKRPIELKKYYFERVELRLPSFPGEIEKVTINSVRGKYVTFLHKKKKNFVAYKWIFEIAPTKKREQKVYRVVVGIVGIFEVKDPRVGTASKAVAAVKKVAEDMLIEVVRLNLDKVFFHSMIKEGLFPRIDMKTKKRVAK